MIDRLRRLTESHWQLLVAVGAAWFVFEHLHPGLVLSNTTPTGGDTGLHIWGPDTLRGLLADGRTSGWSNDWFAGFPAFRFYMVAPSALVLLLDTVFAQNVAFKLVAAAGPTALPLVVYGFARAARWREPAPGLAAIATLPFLFDRYHQIWGGNIAADLAGEIGYSLSLVTGFGALAGVAAGLRAGGSKARAAALTALAVLFHPIAALLVVAGWLALILTHERPVKAMQWSLVPSSLGAAATAFWVAPFVFDRSLSVDLGWEPIENVWMTLTRLEAGPTSLRWEVGAALLGAIAAISRRHRTEAAMVIAGVSIAVAVALVPEGRLWNARLIPLWYLYLHIVAALGVTAILRGMARRESMLAIQRRLSSRELVVGSAAALAGAIAATLFSTPAATLVVGVGFAVMAVEIRRSVLPLAEASMVLPVIGLIGVVLLAVALPLRSIPGGSTDADGTYRWGPFSSDDQSFLPLWSAWNMEGFEAKAGDDSGGGWSEYESIVSTMADLGESHGCGRTMWEAGAALGRYGTPGAMALLPYWTNGCITSMEGLFFESSATSPYHFINQVELSANPLPALKGIDYPSFDVAEGVDHLIIWGVRYYLAFEPGSIAAARTDGRLIEVAASDPWVVFEIPEAQLVAPLELEPVVVVDVDDSIGWRDAALLSYNVAIDPRVPLVSGGPDEWSRVPADLLEIGVGAPRLEPVEVTEITVEDNLIRFRVDQTGVPVAVGVSWFPAWEAHGASGPYRMAPNLMVVVPTQNVVELRFGDRPLDRPSQAVSVLAVGAMVVIGRRGRHAGTIPAAE